MLRSHQNVTIFLFTRKIILSPEKLSKEIKEEEKLLKETFLNQFRMGSSKLLTFYNKVRDKKN